MNISKEYERNEKFKRFVDKCSKTYGIPVSEALEQKTVQEVAKYYREEGETHASRTEVINCGC